MKVAVIAHAGKTFGGGLPELRRVLDAEGVRKPLWYEVPKSKKAPPVVERALAEGAELIFAWGGDGMVQRCVDVLAGTDASLAIIPAGTSNLFATNLGIKKDIEEAVQVGLRGDRRKLDVGRFNGERFAVMAGAGFDAAMIKDASGLKTASRGTASFYTEGTKTASGEEFDTLEMTAAHPTLPFGTKLRVTNVASGRSVTVRVNDRGPYVQGRVVDVSYSAADALGMVGKGVAKVKLDVVQ